MDKRETRQLIAQKEIELDKWCREIGLVGPGQVLEINIRIRGTPVVSIVLKKRIGQIKARRTNEPITDLDWEKILGSGLCPSHEQVLQTLYKRGNEPTKLTELMGEHPSIREAINTFFLRRDLPYRLAPLDHNPGCITDKNLKLFHVQ